MNFLDEALLQVRGGRGGDGCVAFRREKFVPRGGPSGGDGGRGGSVYLVGERGLNTLYHLRVRSLHAAERGRHGEGSNRTGRSGRDREVPVPLGTQVYIADGDRMVGEILAPEERLLVARGGRGGRGNASFATATRQAPRTAERGEPGEERILRLELKLLADVGIVGLPNAGKSTFISLVSAARPKVADYPFTTLVPSLGVVAEGPDRTPFVIADLPGLIAGAAQGAGLGHRFLRHVERCRILLHFVDLSGGEREAEEEVEIVERELGAFDSELLGRWRCIVGTKLDAAVEERRHELRAAAARRGLLHYEVSSVDRRGVGKLITDLERQLRKPA